MTREILFRGKCKETGKWVYGNLIKLKILTSICVESEYDNLDGDAYFNECCFPVIPKTVGMFTGLKDKNGTKIFEGDIIKLGNDFDKKITFSNGCFWAGNKELYNALSWGVEVIGNIFEEGEKE